MPIDKYGYHSIIAGYFLARPLFYDVDQQKQPDVRKLVEQPFQQTKAQQWDEVTDTLCDLEFIQAKSSVKMTYNLVDDLNAVLQIIPDNADNIVEESKRQARLDKYRRDSISYARGELLVLEVPECEPLWNQEKICTEVERIRTNLTRLDRLKDFHNFLGHEAGNLQKYAWEFPHFAVQQAWNYADGGPVGIAAENRIPAVCDSLLLYNKTSRPPWNPIPQSINTLKGHSGTVCLVSFIDDGKWAFTVSREDEKSILWDLNTGQETHTLLGNNESYHTVAITPDTRRAISCYKNTGLTWNVNTGQILNNLKGHTTSINAVDITPDGKKAVTSSIDNTFIWDLNTNKVLHILKGQTGICSVIVTAGGEKVLSNSSDISILWDINTGQVLQTLDHNKCYFQSVAVTPDGRKAIVGYLNNDCVLWDLDTGHSIYTLKGHAYHINHLAITPDGKKAISCSWDKNCILWDLITGQLIYILKSHTGCVNAVAITPDGKRAVSGSADNTCIVWDLSVGQVITTLKGHTAEIHSVAITDDGKRVLSGSEDQTCKVWEINSMKSDNTFKDHDAKIYPVAISPDGKFAISGGEDKKCILWNLETGFKIHTFNLNANATKAIVFTPDGKRAITSFERETCNVWDLETGRSVTILKEHTNTIYTIAITPDGKRAITGSADHNSIIWDMVSFKSLTILKGDASLTSRFINITTSGNKAILGFDYCNSFVIYDLVKGKSTHLLSGHTETVNDVAVTPDGKRAISCSDDNNCVIWDLTTGQVIGTLRGSNKEILSVTVTPDGRRAISREKDLTSRIWDLRNGQIIRSIPNVYVEPITYDGKTALSLSELKTCEIRNMEDGKRLGVFVTSSNLSSLAHFPGGVFIGESSGKVDIIFNQAYLNPSEYLITIRSIFDNELHEYLSPSADCPRCGNRFAPPPSVLTSIEKITQETGLKPEQSPCLELPDEAWEDPGLLGECPKCGGKLRFNPFVAGQDN